MEILDNRYMGALLEVYKEVARAKAKFPKDFSTRHEAYAVTLEELDELWDDIKADSHLERPGVDVDKAVQVAAMALRYVAEFGNFSRIAPAMERSGTGELIKQALKPFLGRSDD